MVTLPETSTQKQDTITAASRFSPDQMTTNRTAVKAQRAAATIMGAE